MLNVNELENKWRKYKIKSYIPYGIIIVSLSIVAILISSIYNSKTFSKKITKVQLKEESKIQKQTSITTKQIEQNITKIAKVTKPKKEVLKEKTSNSKKIILSPSLGFMSEMKHNAISYYESNEIPTSTTHRVVQKPKTKKPQPTKIKEPKQQITKKSNIQIKRHNTQDDIGHVIKRFKKNNNPALSLFVAKKYYELGEYNKSYNYALITNEINDNIDASWIVFAKSLVKINKKDEAIKTLKKYIEYSHSGQAKILLEEIISGKFK